MLWHSYVQHNTNICLKTQQRESEIMQRGVEQTEVVLRKNVHMFLKETCILKEKSSEGTTQRCSVRRGIINVSSSSSHK